MRFLSLFSGIGGMDLGLEMAGWSCAGQVEINRFALAVLAKHWPDTYRWNDVKSLTADDVRLRVGNIDAIVGGFPCQDISVAGLGAGVEHGERSGLWREFYRLVCGLRPRWVVIENVSALRTRGADTVLGDMEEAGYTCWPCVVGADTVGAPHRRERVIILAKLANADDAGLQGHQRVGPTGEEGLSSGHASECCAHRRWWGVERSDYEWPSRPGQSQHEWEWPRIESSVGGATDGVLGRLDGRRQSLIGYGNAVVPQLAQLIGETINAVEFASATP